MRQHCDLTLGQLAQSNALDEVYRGDWADPSMAKALERVRLIIFQRLSSEERRKRMRGTRQSNRPSQA